MIKKLKKGITIYVVIFIGITVPICTFANAINVVENRNQNLEFGLVDGIWNDCGHALYYVQDGDEKYLAFSLEMDNSLAKDRKYIYSEEYETYLNSGIFSYIAEMIYFGYVNDYGYSIPTTKEEITAACCTQQFVWEELHVSDDVGRNTWAAAWLSSSIYLEWLDKTTDIYDSYHKNVSFDGDTLTLDKGETIIYDENEVLKGYMSFNETVGNINFYHAENSNELKVTVDDDSKVGGVTFFSKDYGLYKDMESLTHENYVYFRFNTDEMQNLIFSDYIGNVSFSINIDVNQDLTGSDVNDDESSDEPPVDEEYIDQDLSESFSQDTEHSSSLSEQNLELDNSNPKTKTAIKELEVKSLSKSDVDLNDKYLSDIINDSKTSLNGNVIYTGEKFKRKNLINIMIVSMSFILIIFIKLIKSKKK